MIKKILSYQMLLWNAANMGYNNVKAGAVAAGYVCYVFASIFLASLLKMRSSVLIWLFVIIVFALLTAMSGNMPLTRSVPVSDRFHIANVLFVFPLLPIAAFFAVAVSLFNVIGLIFHVPELCFAGDRFRLYPHSFFSGTSFLILFLSGVWFLMMCAALHRRRLTRCLCCLAIFSCVLAFFATVSLTLSRQGYHNTYSIAEIPELISPAWMLGGAAVFAAGAGIFAWKRCLFLFRADLKGQAKQSQKPMTQNTAAGLMQRKKFARGRSRGQLRAASICALVVSAVVIGLSAGGFFGKGMSFSAESRSVSDYTAWNAMTRQDELPAHLYFTSSGLLSFPESVDEDTAIEYYAHVWGEYGDNWSSCCSVRFLLLELPQEQYAEEKARVSGLSLTHDGQTNTMLHDTEHFAGDAYIAQFSSKFSQYEYVLFDDEKRQVTYVFSEGDASAPGDIPTQRDFWVNTRISPVPLRRSNDDNGGYSLYSFWDDGYYTEWWPGR